MNKLLIVDDDIGSRTFAVNAVMKEWPNCSTLSAPNGLVGLRIALAELPEIILLDWEMPEMDGIAMLKALRAAYETKNIPVIMYTGIRKDSGSLKLALEAGADEFLRKPVDLIELTARIRSIYLRIRLAREKKKAEEENKALEKVSQQRELMLKKNDLASLSLILEQKEARLKTNLKALEACLEESNATLRQVKLKHIVQGIRSELKSDSNWEAIKTRMNGIHSEFLALLVGKHPRLSSNELKLCTLMKLNLSLKEVAQILHISVGAVEKARYRLRKKLSLPSDIKLDNYIHSISTLNPV